MTEDEIYQDILEDTISQSTKGICKFCQNDKFEIRKTLEKLIGRCTKCSKLMEINL